MTDEAKKAQHAVDYLFEQTTNLGSPITYTACLVMAKHILQPGTLAREEVARIIRKHVRMLKDGDDASQIAVSVDAILALAPSHEAGTQEPVAWTNKAQLGFLKDPSCFGIPMAMWGEPHERAHSVPLYAAPQPASVAHDATRDEILRGLATFFEESEHLVWSNGEIADCLAMMVYDGPSVPSTDRGGQ